MKIAMVYDMIYPFNVGGAEARNYLLAKELIKRGHEVHFFGAKLWKGQDVITYDGIIMHGVYTSKSLYKNSRRSYDEPIIFALKLIRPLFREEFDLVDCTAFPFFHAFVCKLYSVFKKIPLILTWHEVWSDYWTYYIGFKGCFGRFIEKIASKMSKSHIVVSERTKLRLLMINKSAKITVVSNALQLDIISSVPKSEERYDLIFCGRLLPHKNVDLLIKSVRILKEEFPSISCLIIGSGPEKERLVALANRLGVDKNVAFKNFLTKQEEVYSYLKSSKIFVFPSILEGFGIVVIEAMACGLPVVGVSHKWNAAEDIINDNKAGFVVEQSPIVVAERISFLLRNKRTYNKISKNNLSKSKKYSVEKVARRIERIYEGLL
ncbi:MAG: glycosyltransferase family 4 protein [Nanoarchaeota archaeon]|nr:glycosyltransferase family 4 protein [Nanoarchaeota archaeon]MBU1269449.1 glycosyltransferase family 4 protein [Nanoarchaeota archaeon]MBU1604606.1 glycosyltransferase family 4 protein [Nanoarchaeota archaeon]MBU2442756.1 glycosyltransferase family 4 protein [Nanoarchaeota archaeon]